MNLADIRTWLASGQDFAQGVALYAALGTSQVYQRLFSLGETDYSRPVLLRELRSLASTGESAEAPPAVPVLVSVPVFPLEPVAPVVSPDESPLLTRLHQQLRAVRDERSHLHPQLTASGLRKTARLAVALRIVALTGQEVELLAHINYARQHGRLPGPVATADVSDRAELLRRLHNARSRRSKLRKLPDAAAELAAAETEIQLIQSKLTP